MFSLPLRPCVLNKNRLQATYSLFGLVFACLSAALIIASVQPLPRTVVQKQIRHTVGNTAQKLGGAHPPVQVEQITTETRLVRGGNRHFLSEPPHRRLTTTKVTAPLHHASSSTLSEKGDCTYTRKATNPTASASSVPNQRQLDDGGRENTVMQIVPAAMVAVSTSIIFCALLLYCSDVRDRYRRKKELAEEQQRQEDQFDDDNSSFKSHVQEREEGGSMTSASSASASETGGYWVQTLKQGYSASAYGAPPSMLPPMDDQRDDVDCDNHANADSLSISQVSTLTETVAEGGYYGYSEIEERLDTHALETSSHVTPLSADHRVTYETTLSTFVASKAEDVVKVESDCSSLTNGSATDSENLVGEDCLEDDAEEEVTKTIPAKDTPNSKASLEFSQDTSMGDDGIELREERDANGDKQHQDGASEPKRVGPENCLSSDELIQLEQLIATVPYNKAENAAPRSPTRPKANSDCVVRDIYFVPVSKGSKGTIGLQVEDALSASTHPEVSKVELSSTFVGRIFAGDLIMSVNDVDTLGSSGTHVLNLMEGNDDDETEEGSQHEVEEMIKMVKVKVLSSETDGASLSEDDGQRSLDFGVPDTCVEL